MATTLVAIPARLGDIDLSKAVVGVADSIVDALPDRQSAERVVEALSGSALVAAESGRRSAGIVGRTIRSHPRWSAAAALLLVTVLVVGLNRRSRRTTTLEASDVPLAA